MFPPSLTGQQVTGHILRPRTQIGRFWTGSSRWWTRTTTTSLKSQNTGISADLWRRSWSPSAAPKHSRSSVTWTTTNESQGKNGRLAWDSTLIVSSRQRAKFIILILNEVSASSHELWFMLLSMHIILTWPAHTMVAEFRILLCVYSLVPSRASQLHSLDVRCLFLHATRQHEWRPRTTVAEFWAVLRI